MTNLRFELKIIFKSRKILIALILALLISGLLFFINSFNRHRTPQKLTDAYYTWYEKLSEESAFCAHRMSENTVEKEDQQKFLAPNEKLRTELIAFFDLVSMGASDERVYQQQPDAVLRLYEAYEVYRKTMLKPRLNIPTVVVNTEKAYYGYLSEHALRYEDDAYSVSGANFVKSVLDKLLGLPLALMLVLLCADIFAGENQNGVLGLRKIQPRSRLSLFYSKIMATLIYSLFFIVSIIVFSYFIAGIFGTGFGDFSYPVKRGPLLLQASQDSDLLFEIVPIYQYLLLSIGYFLGYLVFILSIVSLLAVILKDSLLLAATSLVLLPISHSVSLAILESKMGAWIGGIHPEFPIFNPFMFEFQDQIIQDLRILPYVMIIPLAFFTGITFGGYLLSKNTYVQNLFLKGKIKDADKSLCQYERKKGNKLTLLRFELLKIVRQKEVYITVFMITALLILNFYNSVTHYTQSYQAQLDLLEWQIEKVENQLIYFTAEAEGRRQKHFELEAQKKAYIKYRDGYINKDWQTITEHLISEIKYAQKHEHGFMGYDTEGFTPETIKINMRKLDTIKKRGLQTELPSTWQVEMTPFSKFKERSDYIKYLTYSRRYHPSLTYNVNAIFKSRLSYLLMLVMTVFLARGFSVTNQKSNALRLLNIQPVKRRNIYLSILASSAAFVLVVGISFSVSALTLLFFTQSASADYPSIHYENNVDQTYQGEQEFAKRLAVNREEGVNSKDTRRIGYRFRQMMTENAEMTLSFILSGLFILSLATLLSLWIKNRWMNTAISIALYSVAYGVSAVFLKTTSAMLPFIWLDSHFISSGQANIIYDAQGFGIWEGVMCLSIWTVCLAFLGMMRYQKKQCRG